MGPLTHCLLPLASDIGQITAKLDAIEQRMASRRGRSARDSDEAAQAAQADDDEEDERAAWLLRIQSAVYKAIDLQPLLATEAALLASRPVLTPQMSAAAQAAGGEPRPTAPSMVVIDALSRVTMTSERERMRGEVFRPSHILPTMTIEQFGAFRARAPCMLSTVTLTLTHVRRAASGELEYQRMVEAEASRQKAETAARDAAAGSRSDDEAEEDAKLAKARSWDDWKVRCDWAARRCLAALRMPGWARVRIMHVVFTNDAHVCVARS